MSQHRRLRAIEPSQTPLPADMNVDDLVRLTLTEADVVAQLVGGITRLQRVQQAKALLARIEDPAELRGLLSKPTGEGQ